MSESDGNESSEWRLQKAGREPAELEPSASDSLVTTLGQEIQRGHLKIVSMLTASAVLAIEIGLKLIQVKTLLPHGQYLNWIDEHLTPTCGITQRTAQRYKNLAENEKRLLEYVQTEYLHRDGPYDDQRAKEVLATLKMSDATRLLSLKGTKPRYEIEPVVHAHSAENAIAFYEIEAAAKAKPNLTLHLVVSGEGKRLDAEMITSEVGGDLQNAKVSFCGPVLLRNALQNGLRRHGITGRRFHFEEFEFRTGIGLKRLARWVLARRSKV